MICSATPPTKYRVSKKFTIDSQPPQQPSERSGSSDLVVIFCDGSREFYRKGLVLREAKSIIWVGFAGSILCLHNVDEWAAV